MSPRANTGESLPPRTFGPDEQLAFAELSGDWNPVHVDELAARRLLYGRRLVHGMHALLWCLGGLRSRTAPGCGLTALRARFRGPIPLGSPLRRRVGGGKREGEWRLVLEGEGRDLATATALLGDAGSVPRARIPRGRFPRNEARERSSEELSGARGRVPLALDEELAERLLPDAHALLTPLQLAQLLAVTRLLGMECPGLHSLFAELDLAFEPARGVEAAALGYAVRSFDTRFRRLDVEIVSAGCRGTATAFVRPRAREQVAYAQLHDVRPREFAGVRALVVGGSRGLGEVASKLLAAGGADVRLTYARGHGDAERVAGEIRAGGGAARALRVDVRDPAETLLSELEQDWTPNALLYFATPRIVRRTAAGFSGELLHAYTAFYVEGFDAALRAVLARGPDPLAVLYPSTVFLDEVSTGFAEYVVAKAAGEALCDLLKAEHERISLHRPRLPRLATDQTASLLGEDAADPVPALLAELRRLRSPAARGAPSAAERRGRSP